MSAGRRSVACNRCLRLLTTHHAKRAARGRSMYDWFGPVSRRVVPKRAPRCQISATVATRLLSVVGTKLPQLLAQMFIQVIYNYQISIIISTHETLIYIPRRKQLLVRAVFLFQFEIITNKWWEVWMVDLVNSHKLYMAFFELFSNFHWLEGVNLKINVLYNLMLSLTWLC